MNTDRMYEHEIDRWESEGGSFQLRKANSAKPFVSQPRSWVERKQKWHDGDCRKKNQQLKRYANS